MATARPAFDGKSKASLIAAILASEPPPISSLQPLTPPALDRLVRTCLSKDPDERIQSAHDLKLQLELVAKGGTQMGLPAVASAKAGVPVRLWMGAAALFLVTTLALAAAVLLRPAPDTFLIRASIPAPADQRSSCERLP